MASRFWVGGTGTWDASDTTHWAASSGGAGGQSVPGTSDTVTFDGSSGGNTATVNATIAVQSITMSAFTGTLDFSANNNNVTLSSTTAFVSTGAGTRTLNMGNGTWSLTATSGTIWNCAGNTNFTLNCNSSVIDYNATATTVRTFAGGAKTYNTFSVTNPVGNAFTVFINQSNTFANLTMTNVRHLLHTGGTTTTISGTLTFSGTLAAPAMWDMDGSSATISVASAQSLAWLSLNSIVKAGAGSITVTNGMDCGGNTSVTINPPGFYSRARAASGF